jgi:hypothetical protein
MTGRVQKTIASALLAVTVVGAKVALRMNARAEREAAAQVAEGATPAPARTFDAEQAPAGDAPAGDAPARTVAQGASLTPPAAGDSSAAAPVLAPGGPAATTGSTTTGSAAIPQTAGRSVAVAVGPNGVENDAAELTFVRETFSYAGQGRRDPFVSLLANGELKPMITDLRLVAVAYDASGRNSVAIMRDVNTKQQYRVRPGQTLGRMRVASIRQKQVLFTIEEFGYSRQEVLALGDSTTARTK